MRFGIVTYQIAYFSERGKVCISTTDIEPAPIRCFTRDEILALIAETHNGLKAIYQTALNYFPAERGQSQS